MTVALGFVDEIASWVPASPRGKLTFPVGWVFARRSDSSRRCKQHVGAVLCSAGFWKESFKTILTFFFENYQFFLIKKLISFPLITSSQDRACQRCSRVDRDLDQGHSTRESSQPDCTRWQMPHQNQTLWTRNTSNSARPKLRHGQCAGGNCTLSLKLRCSGTRN